MACAAHPVNSSTNNSTRVVPGDNFVPTRWTLVISAGRKSSPQSDQALADLCRTYWYPLYAYVRRQGHSRENAEDLTQAFFARFLQKNYLEGLSSDRGKFRAFMLACMKHFLANEWDKNTRQKRGGTAQHLSLDWQSADERYHLDPPDNASPDVLYDREWALALLEQVVTRLRKEYTDVGKGDLFEHAKGFLMGTGDVVPHAKAANNLNMEEGALRVAVHRMRKRYRDMLKEEISQTLCGPADVQDELRSLQQALIRHA
jgi:DNA-directed RNA polymerase specialized sigma24 family protein